MNNSETDMLFFLEEGCEGDYETSDRTPRTTQGVTGSASDAGEQTNILREEEFRALMEGEYKDLFTAYFQQTFNRRFKEYKQIKAELDSYRAVLDAVHERFGELSGDALLAAIRAENKTPKAPTEVEKSIPKAEIAIGKKEIAEACAKAEHRLLSHIRARGLRPLENGVYTQSACTASDIKMTREERAELAKRAERGERIVL